jgi:hypothetical protein
MFTYHKPKYQSKRVHPVTQKPEPSYQFDMEYKQDIIDSPLSWIVKQDDPFTVSSLVEELNIHTEWWDSVLHEFLQANSSYFSRPYTAQQIKRIIQHRLNGDKDNMLYPLCVCCIPYRMELAGGVMYVDWKYKAFPVGIDIPVEEQENTELPVINHDKLLQKREEIEEWDPEEVPLSGEEKEENPIQDGVKQMDKQRVREARLKAKLAVYRAQYQMNQFYDKYGDEVSDSDTEEDDEDEEDEEELQV